MRVAGTSAHSLVDGPGLNFVIFTQGCNKLPKCPGCHNPATHDPAGGYDLSVAELFELIKQTKGITGVTFSGGEPLDQFSEVAMLARMVVGHGLQTILYTGFTLTVDDHWARFSYGEDAIVMEWAALDYFDYIIDGNFRSELKDITKPFKGSTNQRILKVGRDY